MGFSRWRNICPLALISKVSQNINLVKKRHVPEWFEENFWYFQYALLFIALSLRLTILNFDENFLVIFFIFIILAAFFTNLIFTGKSWCNFFCPVSVVEKVYSVSNAKNYKHNSACGTCTACKKNCPDIDLEMNYWKEGALKQKTFVFYSLPGMILGFYLYFCLLSGDFEYYFAGTWTTNRLALTDSGFFFLPSVPLFIAAPLTLLLFTLSSFYLFKIVEQFLWSKKIFKKISYDTATHRVKTVAAFVAFNIFYIFAGAPTYIHYPIAYRIFYFLVIALSSTILYKEIFRQEAYYIQERFALKFIKSWSTKKSIPANLKEIYYTYFNDNKTKKERLKMYEESITELMQEGVLNEGSMKILEKLREQIGITKKEHQRVLRQIKQENELLFDNTVEKSAEKLFQENSYKALIQNALNEHFEIEEVYLQSLQVQFDISSELHAKIMATIVKENATITEDIMLLLDKIHQLITVQSSIYEDGTREIFFLKYCVKNEFIYLCKNLFSILFTLHKEHHKVLKSLLKISKEHPVDESFNIKEDTLSFLDKDISQKMSFIQKGFFFSQLKASTDNNPQLLQQLLIHESLQIATAALLYTKNDTNSYLTQECINRFDTVEEQEIQSLLYKLIYKTQEITTYEKMMYLNHISIFTNLKFDDLFLLGKTAKIVHYSTGEYITKKGSLGSTLYVLIRGGAITLTDGIITQKLGHRDYFGEVALLGDTKRTSSVKVTQETIALTITKKQFKRFLEKNPQVSAKVIKEIIKKLL